MDDMTVYTFIDVASRWLHVKSGGTYEVVAVGRIEADLSPVVIYRSDKDGTVWVRPIDEFEDGRFKCLDNANEF